MNPDRFGAALFTASPDGLLVVDADGIVRIANPMATKMFGYAADGMEGLPVEQLVPEEYRSRHMRDRDRYMKEAEPRSMGSGLRLFAQHADGDLFPVEISLSPVILDDEAFAIATVRDVSEREEASASLELLMDRERIARDLHDMVIQRIFAAGMNLQAVLAEVGSPLVARRIHDTVDDLDATIGELRAAIFRLSQPEGERSVSTRLAAVIDERARQLGFVPEMIVTGDVDDLPDYVAEQLVATFSEGLSNVVRHAGADAVTIHLERSSSTLRLEISDNGVGVSPQPKRGGGITNMMWRAAELGGTCTIGASRPAGTVLVWDVPA